MIQELNLTPSQAIVLIVLLLFVLLANIHNPIEIELPKKVTKPQQPTNANYGHYLQSQSKYYN